MPISKLIAEHETRFFRSINLVASENLLSHEARRALASDVAMRYCIPPENERPASVWDYPNQTFVREITRQTEALAKTLFSAAFADARPLSGNQIASIILSSLCERGDTVWSVPAASGGHFATPVIAAEQGLKLTPIPYDRSQGIIDIEATAKLAKAGTPKLIFLDASMQLFPYPLRELREVVGPEPIISYDASHTLGLIAGRAFQQPLLEGADLLHGSTHKTLWGPQKGLITVRQEGPISQIIRGAITPRFVSNMHVHHVAALGIALEEARDFGQEYARSVIRNAKELARSLADRGVNVLFANRGATESHQVLVEIGSHEKSIDAWKRLERAGLHTNAISLPFRNNFGFRIGTAEATRRGLGAEQMRQIAGWISACIEDKTSVDTLASAVSELSQQFVRVCYSNDMHCSARNFELP